MQSYLDKFTTISSALTFAERCLLRKRLPEAAQEYKATGRAQPEFWEWCAMWKDRQRKPRSKRARQRLSPR